MQYILGAVAAVAITAIILSVYDLFFAPELPEYEDSVFLIPEVWQAVRKVEGWGMYLCEGCGCNFNPPETRHELHRTCIEKDTCRGIWVKDWKHNTKAMIDHLAEGGTIESYLETI